MVLPIVGWILLMAIALYSIFPKYHRLHRAVYIRIFTSQPSSVNLELGFDFVGLEGLEPSRLSAPDPKSGVLYQFHHKPICPYGILTRGGVYMITTLLLWTRRDSNPIFLIASQAH